MKNLMSLMSKRLCFLQVFALAVVLAGHSYATVARDVYYSSKLNEQLVRIVAYAYNEQQGQGAFFQDSLEGVVAFLYADNPMQGRVELIDVKMKGHVFSEHTLSTFYYNLRAPELIYSRFKQQVLPAHFRGQMGPMLIVHHGLEGINLLWYAHGKEQLLLSDLEITPIIGYLGDDFYQVVVPVGEGQYNHLYFDAATGRISMAFDGIISINESLGLVLFSPSDSNELYLASIFASDPQEAKKLDLEEFNQELPLGQVISEVQWHLHSHENEQWAQIMLRFITDRGMLSRAFYHSATAERIYFN